MIAIKDVSLFISPDGPVGVSIVGNAQVSSLFDYCPGQALWMERTAAGIDIPTIRRIIDGYYLEVEGFKQPGGQF